MGLEVVVPVAQPHQVDEGGGPPVGQRVDVVDLESVTDGAAGTTLVGVMTLIAKSSPTSYTYSCQFLTFETVNGVKRRVAILGTYLLVNSNVPELNWAFQTLEAYPVGTPPGSAQLNICGAYPNFGVNPGSNVTTMSDIRIRTNVDVDFVTPSQQQWATTKSPSLAPPGFGCDIRSEWPVATQTNQRRNFVNLYYQ